VKKSSVCGERALKNKTSGIRTLIIAREIDLNMVPFPDDDLLSRRIDEYINTVAKEAYTVVMSGNVPVPITTIHPEKFYVEVTDGSTKVDVSVTSVYWNSVAVGDHWYLQRN